ncbi:MAG: phosphotransferase family protein [Pirellulaceae bacterium]|nr:phosphotransferase family protein [Pirellulaceae bacterium]
MNTYTDETQPIRPGEELNVPALEAYLRAHFEVATSSLEVKQFPGGSSNLTYLVRAGDLEVVLRRPPFGNQVKSAHDMGREYRVLSKLSAVYGPAPRPLAYCEDDQVLGALFYLMEFRRGVILRQQPPPGLSLDPNTMARLSESFVDNLVRLHRIDYRAVGLEDLGRPVGYVRRQVEGWAKRYASARTNDAPDLDQLIRWLDERVPSESGASLVHNDYKYDNLILDPQDITRIVGVLDWEMCTIGDPLMDLGTSLAYWVEASDPDLRRANATGPTALLGSFTRRQLVERYAERTGCDISNMLFYYCFGLFKLAVIVQQIYARYVRGHTRDERFSRLNEWGEVLNQTARRALDADEY